jgi:hypothetical protein
MMMRCLILPVCCTGLASRAPRAAPFSHPVLAWLQRWVVGGWRVPNGQEGTGERGGGVKSIGMCKGRTNG